MPQLLFGQRFLKDSTLLLLNRGLSVFRLHLGIASACALLHFACDSSEPPRMKEPAPKVKAPPLRIKKFHELSYSGTIRLHSQDIHTTGDSAASPVVPKDKTETSSLPPLSLNRANKTAAQPEKINLRFAGEAQKLVRGEFQLAGRDYVLNGTREAELLRVRVTPKNLTLELTTLTQAYRGVGLLHYRVKQDKVAATGTIEGDLQLGRGDAKAFTRANIHLAVSKP